MTEISRRLLEVGDELTGLFREGRMAPDRLADLLAERARLLVLPDERDQSFLEKLRRQDEALWAQAQQYFAHLRQVRRLRSGGSPSARYMDCRA